MDEKWSGGSSPRATPWNLLVIAGMSRTTVGATGSRIPFKACSRNGEFSFKTGRDEIQSAHLEQVNGSGSSPRSMEVCPSQVKPSRTAHQKKRGRKAVMGLHRVESEDMKINNVQQAITDVSVVSVDGNMLGPRFSKQPQVKDLQGAKAFNSKPARSSENLGELEGSKRSGPYNTILRGEEVPVRHIQDQGRVFITVNKQHERLFVTRSEESRACEESGVTKAIDGEQIHVKQSVSGSFGRMGQIGRAHV